MKKGMVVCFVLCSMLYGCKEKSYRHMEGKIYGTYYHVTYESDADLGAGVREQMERVNASLSMFDGNSLISRINRGETNDVDSLFSYLFGVAQRVNRESDGAFDITVAPLSNAWGFGYKNDSLPSPEKVDSLLRYVGMSKMTLDGKHLIISQPGMKIDASAIAKGLGVDLAAEYLEAQGIINYMVEIGGEVRVKGLSEKQRPWRIGIDKPIDDVTASDRELELVVSLSVGSLATSGNYRNYYIRDGKKYAHTIDPRTGYPVQQDILSSSVYAPTCMEADAFATAFMVLGLEKSKEVVKNNPELDACFIYNEGDSLKVWMSDKFKQLLLRE